MWIVPSLLSEEYQIKNFDTIKIGKIRFRVKQMKCNNNLVISKQESLDELK